LLSHPAPWAKVRPEIMVANNSHHLAVQVSFPLPVIKGAVVILLFLSSIFAGSSLEFFKALL
jgi:hypothetical protein